MKTVAILDKQATMEERQRWEFWIDVGGTFTDCFARTPDGRLLRHKLLSSGITPGRVGDQSDQQRIIDPLRSGDPPGYWTDYQIRIEHEQLDVPFESRVCQSDPAGGLLLIDPPLPLPVQVGARYELRTEEEAPLAAVRYLSGRTLAEPLPEADVRLGTTRGTNALLTRSGAKTALVTTRGFADVLLVGYQDRPRLFDLQIRKFPPLYEATIEIDERISAEGEVLQSPDAPDRANTTHCTPSRWHPGPGNLSVTRLPIS